jgi:hypothetical protein
MSQEWRENQIWLWRQRLRPYVAEVINRLEKEEQERNLNVIRQRKRNTFVSVPIKQADSKKA